jgi:hypothetical protein
MVKRYGFYWFLMLVLTSSITLHSGCAKPPTYEVENAEKAIAEAKQKEADLYVQDVFMKAEEALKRAKDSIAVKKYKEAKTDAMEAANLARQAISAVEPNKTKMKAEAEQIIQDVQKSIDEVKTLTATAVKKKALINREEIQGKIGKWEIDIVSIKDQLQEQKIRQAYDQLISIQEQMKSQKGNLAAVLEQKPVVKK